MPPCKQDAEYDLNTCRAVS